MYVNSKKTLRPRRVKLEASTVCQLRCPTCPNASGKIKEHLGTGTLCFADFRKFIDDNRCVSHIELSNWGEIFLNKDLPEILRYAYEKNVALSALNGVNLNDVSETVLEMLARYRFRTLSCSIDGVVQETYGLYRRNGDLSKVIENIKKINRFKFKYRTRYPVVSWQFIIFEHNQHEIQQARRMALDLNMNFNLKLAWDNLHGEEVFSAGRDFAQITKETGLDVADRREYRQKHGREYRLSGCCRELWHQPQVNFDGRVLGCSINYWADYGNAFAEGLQKVINSEKMGYARLMLMGKRPPRNDIPCFRCLAYQTMQNSGAWLTDEEVAIPYGPRQGVFMLQNKAPRIYPFLQSCFYHKPPHDRPRLRPMRMIRRILPRSKNRLLSNVYSIKVPGKAHPQKGWTPTHFFKGSTRTLRSFSCHASVLAEGHCPHLPHEHRDEEILLLLSGQVDLIFPDQTTGAGNFRQSLRPGELVYYPRYYSHTLQTTDTELATYLMFRWEGRKGLKGSSLSFADVGVLSSNKSSDSKRDFSFITLFEGRTAYLQKLHCHLSTLTPGSGYAPHADPYDVVMVVLEGVVETLDRRIGPYAVIFYPEGEHHGIRNVGQDAAKYLVFEFHGQKPIHRRLLHRMRRTISKWSKPG